MSALLNTLTVMACAALVSMACGGAAGVVLGRTRQWPFWRGAFLTAAFIPLFVQAAAWDAAWGSFGWVTLTQAGDRQSSVWTGVIAASWVHGLAAAPWTTLFVGEAIRALRSDLLDATQLEARPLAAFCRILFPLVLPALWLGGLLTASIAATEFVVTDLLRAETLAELTYLRYAVSPEEAPAALAWLVPAAISLGSAAVIGWQIDRTRQAWSLLNVDSSVSPVPGTAFRQGLLPMTGIGTFSASLIGLAIWSLVALVPLLNLIAKAGWQANLEGEIIRHSWSPVRLAETLVSAAERFLPELIWTALLTLLVLLLALPAAVGMARGYWLLPRLRLALIALALMLFVIPGPTLAMWLIAGFNRPGWTLLHTLYDRTLIPTAVSLMARAVPLAFAVLAVSPLGLPGRWFEQSRLEGASTLMSVRWLWWPLRAGWLVGVCWLIGWIVVAEVSACLLLLPPGVTTVGPRVFGLLHAGVRYEESGLCLIVVLVIALGLAVLAVLALCGRQRDRWRMERTALRPAKLLEGEC
jgi:iron(III) transport system permease protein